LRRQISRHLAATIRSHRITATIIVALCLAALGWQFVDQLLLGFAAFQMRHMPWITYASEVVTIGSVVVIFRSHGRVRRQAVDREASLRRMATGQARITRFLAWTRGDLRMAERTGRQARDLFARAGDIRRAMVSANDLAWIRGCLGDPHAQSLTARSVLAWSEQAADDLVTVNALIALGCAATQRGAFAEAEIALDRAIALTAREGLGGHESAARGFLGALKALEGRSYTDVLATASAIGQPQQGVGCEALVLADWLHGEYANAMARPAAIERPSAPIRPLRDWILPFAAMAATEIDQLNRSRSVIAELERRYGGSDFMVVKALVAWAQGTIAWREERLDDATRQLHAAATTLYRMQCDAFASLALFDLAEIGQQRRDHPLTEESADLLEDVARRTGDGTHAALARAARAWTAVEQSEPSGAVALASSAAADLLVAEYRPYSARTLALLGQLLAPHARAEAIKHLESAVNLLVTSGATWRLERCFTLLRTLGHVGRRLVAQTRGPQSMTKRERQVIELAMQGRTTTEIGRMLFIAARTVETHLANSYAKLGLRSRLELIRQGRELNEMSAG
jgi:DNA-binding CsgD family transcriptional regulator